MTQKLLLALLVTLTLSAAGIGEMRSRWAAPLNIPDEGFTLMVSQGDSLSGVVDTLKSAGVIHHPVMVILYGRWFGLDQQIKQGEYLLPQGLTASSLLRLLQRGDTIKYQVTFPEGITLATALEILSQQEKLKKLLEGPDDYRILQLVAPRQQPEGLFFPDTYQYTRGDSDLSILQRAHSIMTEVLEEEWANRDVTLPLTDPYEALILASIVEKETGLAEERNKIAGVFVRRLQKGMPLQTDPTVIYGLGIAFDGNLKRVHLEAVDNPYNTYRHKGLPPTPIALPGRASLRAALHPDISESVYFVARGDGSHVFSSTLDEHARAVRKFQLDGSKKGIVVSETPP